MDCESSEEVRQIQRMVDDFIEQGIEPLEDEYDHFLGEDRELAIMEGSGREYRMSEEYLDLWQEIRERSADAGIWTIDKVQRPLGGQPGRQAILSFDDCRVPETQVLGDVREFLTAHRLDRRRAAHHPRLRRRQRRVDARPVGRVRQTAGNVRQSD